MKNFFSLIVFFCISMLSKAQWMPVANSAGGQHIKLNRERLYQLDLDKFVQRITVSGSIGFSSSVDLLLPNLTGKIEKFNVRYTPVADQKLALKYGLKSYSGTSVNDPERTVRLSVTASGISATIFDGNDLEFIDKVSEGIYSVHSKRSEKKGAFVCGTGEPPVSQAEIAALLNTAAKTASGLSARMSDRKFHTLRIAISTTAEYTNYFGGVPQALAAINHTLTRVNGIFERDLALQLILQDFPQLIFTDPKTDPYSDYTSGANGSWSAELQNTLTSTIGNGAYDLGHLFGANGGGGNAGRVGMVCQDDSADAADLNKGAAFTSPADGKPEGDTFDIDFVAHELGHQLGATHTFSYVLEKQGTSVEPGSGSTIMGYAGITTADVQQHSDAYFHAISIDQIQKKMQAVSCDKEIPIANQPPVIQPLAAYTIPKSTAFVLAASATDPENDPLTYTWEQTNDARSPVTVITGNEPSGPIYRSLPPTNSPVRYFPKLIRVLEGSLTNPTDWESVSHVPRELNFTVTIRDNTPLKQQQQTSSASLNLTVGNDGPFKVITSQIYHNSATPIVWDPANTAAAPYSVANVKIDYSKDGGVTWTVLAATTPNDGSEQMNIPSLSPGEMGYVRISAINNVFYAVGKVTAAAAQTCTGSAPASVDVRDISRTSALVTWTLVMGASYQVRYRAIQEKDWKQLVVNANYTLLSGLKEGTLYELQVAAVCSGTDGVFSKAIQFATQSSLNYCTVMTDSGAEEYISNVTLANVNNDSGASPYSGFTSDPLKLIKLSPGKSYQLSVSFKTKDAASSEAVKAWIDFNANGIFEDSEVVMTPVLTKASPVVASFTVPDNAVIGKVLRMRVALRYNNAAIAPCSGYDYGEIEDYALVIGEAETVFDSPEGMILYPNPATDYLNISNVSAVGPYQLYDMGGRMIKNGSSSESKIYVGDLNPAVYVVVFEAEGEKIRRRFIKN